MIPTLLTLLLTLAQPIALSWGPVSGAASYRAFEGGVSGFYTNSIMVAGTNASFPNDGLKHYFTVSSVDTNGVESSFSKPLVINLPVTNWVQLAVTITGSATLTNAFKSVTNFTVLNLTNPPQGFWGGFVTITQTNIAQ